ncbi:YciI family protein [Microbacterium sp. NPDC089698]|uniref:YciI family protein n=1 Tax=Microbacterium sp. NPDC089698 TaxID=3364200 RepID=UPI0038283C83
MSKYLVLYRSGVSAAEQMQDQDPAAAAEGMKAWMDWAQRAGDAIVDLGSPTQTVSGADPGATTFIGGYSIIEAESPEALTALFEGHPHLTWGGTIEALELLGVPGME